MRAVRTFLEMTDPAALDGAAAPSADAQVGLVRDCPPSFWRRLYAEVGGQYHWVDRLPWTDEEIRAYLSDPALELWLLRVGGETAGYFELRGGADDAFEIVYFGLLPAEPTTRSRSCISDCCRRSSARDSVNFS